MIRSSFARFTVPALALAAAPALALAAEPEVAASPAPSSALADLLAESPSAGRLHTPGTGLLSAGILPTGAPVEETTEAEAPEVVVHGDLLKEERRVGTYNQPEWTTHRRFARSRVYVISEGQWEVEQWYRGRFDRGVGPDHQFQTEIGVGLGHRIQLDLYENIEREHGGPTKHVGVQAEMRYAFADWGELPLNPTLYLEWKFNHAAEDVGEAKLLFADEFSKGWHWALNLSVESQQGGAREFEEAVTGGISYSVIDDVFSVGIELEWTRVTEKGARGDPERMIVGGPSIQWRPTPTTHFDVVTLFGLGPDDRDLTVFLVYGIDFGPEHAKSAKAPTSARRR